MADPLSLLRKFFINEIPILEKSNEIIFEKYSWPKTVKTNYLVKGSGKDGTPKDYYTLECLLFFLKNVHMPHPFYVREADVEKIPAVLRPDRKDLLAYLYGNKNYSTSIDKSAQIEEPVIVKPMSEEEIQNEKVQTFKRKNLEDEIKKAEKQLAETIEHIKEASKTTIPSQSEVMPVKKIEEKRAKHFSKKRSLVNTVAEVPAKYTCFEKNET